MATQPAVTQGDTISAQDMHDVLDSVGGRTSLPHPFQGTLAQGLSNNVFIGNKAAAIKGSIAPNEPAHTPLPPGGSFATPPTNQGKIISGSQTVFINGTAAARAGDRVETCADPTPNQTGALTAAQTTVFIGG